MEDPREMEIPGEFDVRTSWPPRNLLAEWMDSRPINNGAPETKHGWMPAADIYEADGALIIELDLPGMRRKDLQICRTGMVLTVSGKRERRAEIIGNRLHHMEGMRGTFCRRFTLPPSIERDRIKASLTEGVLRIAIPCADGLCGEEEVIVIE